MMTSTTSPAVTRCLTGPEGRAADDINGGSPLVVLVPGRGNQRSTNRFLDTTSTSYDQRSRAAWIGEARHGQVLTVAEAGHYPQSQRPDITAPAIVRFADTVNNRA